MDCGAPAREVGVTMFHQLVTPVGGSLIWSCLVASIPILAVLVLLGVFRRPAWQASSAGLAAALDRKSVV